MHIQNFKLVMSHLPFLYLHFYLQSADLYIAGYVSSSICISAFVIKQTFAHSKAYSTQKKQATVVPLQLYIFTEKPYFSLLSLSLFPPQHENLPLVLLLIILTFPGKKTIANNKIHISLTVYNACLCKFIYTHTYIFQTLINFIFACACRSQ